MNLIREEDLSLYYIITRVINQAMTPGEVPSWDSKLNEIAFKLQESKLKPEIKGFSTIIMQVWEKV